MRRKLAILISFQISDCFVSKSRRVRLDCGRKLKEITCSWQPVKFTRGAKCLS